MTRQDVEQWYNDKTGLNIKQGQARIDKIVAFMKRQRASLSDIEIYSRAVRSDYPYKPLVQKTWREKIGHTSHSTKRTTEYYVQLRKDAR